MTLDIARWAPCCVRVELCQARSGGAAGPEHRSGVRIVRVSDGYAPRVGGIEVQVAGLAAAQAAAGHQVDVVTVTRGRGDANGSPVRVHRLTGPTGPGR